MAPVPVQTGRKVASSNHWHLSQGTCPSQAPVPAIGRGESGKWQSLAPVPSLSRPVPVPSCPVKWQVAIAGTLFWTGCRRASRLRQAPWGMNYPQGVLSPIQAKLATPHGEYAPSIGIPVAIRPEFATAPWRDEISIGGPVASRVPAGSTCPHSSRQRRNQSIFCPHTIGAPPTNR